MNIIKYFLGRNFQKNMFLQLCGQFSKMSLPENQIDAGALSKCLMDFKTTVKLTFSLKSQKYNL